MGDKVKAPFTTGQVENLNRYQRFGLHHGFNCTGSHEGSRKLVATPAGWVCPGCRYTQKWAHDYMAEFSAAREAEVRTFWTAAGAKGL